MSRSLVLLLEDSPARLEAMRQALAALDPLLEVRHWDNAFHMIEDLPPILSHACLLSLDYDLGEARRFGGDNPGTGLRVVDFLCNHPPAAPVIVHTSLREMGREMVELLRACRWRAHQLPLSNREQVTGWVALVQRLGRRV